MRKGRKTAAGICLAILLLCTGCGTEKPAAAEPESEDVTRAAQMESLPEEKTAEQGEETAKQGEERDYEAFYRPVLEETCDVIYRGLDEERDYRYLSTGIEEMAMYTATDEMLETTGYTIRDISGDGIPELLIGAVPKGEPGEANLLMGGYTCKAGEIVCFLDGWARNRYTWAGDGRFYFSGSNGALYSLFGTSRILPDGTELTVEDLYFTWEKDGSETELAFFHNTTGEWDRVVSEELSLSEEAFFGIMEAYEADCLPMPLTPFSAYPYEGAVPAESQSLVRVDFGADVLPGLSYYEDLSSPDTDIKDLVVFQAKEDVAEFRILALELQDVEEDGHAVFETTEIYSQPVLQAGVPLAAPMEFPGDLPQNGFSYVDSAGVTRAFSVSMSGFDGSLVLSPLD